MALPYGYYADSRGIVHNEGPLFEEDSQRSYITPLPASNPSRIVTKSSDANMHDIVDMINQNNNWSAEQAQRQMDYQASILNDQMNYNHDEAEINRMFQQESANRSMMFSSAEAQRERDWQKMMSDTAHQREMMDLKAAGLNPILAANNGASSGAGAAAVGSAAAGYGASSSGTPSGSKADRGSVDSAVSSLLAKMLDNQTEIEKMITSAQVARDTAEMYTGATRYAAELGQIASMYGADRTYDSFMNNPMNVFGHELLDFLNGVKENGASSEKAGKKTSEAVSKAVTKAYQAGQWLKNLFNGKTSYNRTKQYIDTGGKGYK